MTDTKWECNHCKAVLTVPEGPPLRCPACRRSGTWVRPTFREWEIPTIVKRDSSIRVVACSLGKALEKAKERLCDGETIAQHLKITETVLSPGEPAPVMVRQPLCGTACPCLQENLCHYRPDDPKAYDVCPWVTVDNTKDGD